jgi:hypothetical protein
MLISLEDFINRFSTDNFFIDTNQIITFYNYYKYGMYNICGLILRDRLKELSGFSFQKQLLTLNDDDFIININFNNFKYNGNYHLKDIFRKVTDITLPEQYLEYNQDFILFYKHFVLENNSREKAYVFREKLVNEINPYGNNGIFNTTRDISKTVNIAIRYNFYLNFLEIPAYSPQSLISYNYNIAITRDIITYLRVYDVFKNNNVLNYYSFNINTKIEYENLLSTISTKSFENSLFNLFINKLIMEI